MTTPCGKRPLFLACALVILATALVMWPRQRTGTPLTTASPSLPVAASLTGVSVHDHTPVPGSSRIAGGDALASQPPAAKSQPAQIARLPLEEPPAAELRRGTHAIPEQEEQLPKHPGNGTPEKTMSAERSARVEELQRELAAEKNPRLAQRIQLTLGGYHVGDSQWGAAKSLYEELSKSPYPEIRAASLRNLDVVDRNRGIVAEKDPLRRDRLKLDLAGVHQQYGHEQAAKRMLRELQSSGSLEEIRSEAGRRLAAYVSIAPVLPAPVKSTEESK